jgi:hypothetical protein
MRGLESPVESVTLDLRLERRDFRCKLRIPVNLGDCAVPALAKKHRLTPLFLRMEKDLRTVGERVREWLDLELGFVLGG